MLIYSSRLTFAFAVRQSPVQSYGLIEYMLMTQNTANTAHEKEITALRMPQQDALHNDPRTREYVRMTVTVTVHDLSLFSNPEHRAAMQRCEATRINGSL